MTSPDLAKVAAWLATEHDWPGNAPIASTVEERPPDELIVALAEFIWTNSEQRGLYWYDSDGGYDEFLKYMLEWDH